jgi:hypothetical protein
MGINGIYLGRARYLASNNGTTLRRGQKRPRWTWIIAVHELYCVTRLGWRELALRYIQMAREGRQKITVMIGMLIVVHEEDILGSVW